MPCWWRPGGERARLLALAAENARAALKRRRSPPDPGAALLDLQERLQLPNLPSRLECLDISTLQGEQPVGALVAFTDGVPDKSGYRRFRIREVAGQDDYAMLREVVLRHYGKEGQELPDLLVVDGGRGQLNVVLRDPERTGPDKHPGGGPGQGDGAGRPPGARPPLSAGAQESSPACRPTPRAGCCSCGSGTKPTASPSPTTANGPAKRLLASALDQAPGIGPVRRQRLLQHFPNLEALKAATVEEMAALPGFNHKVGGEIERLAGGGRGGHVGADLCVRPHSEGAPMGAPLVVPKQSLGQNAFPSWSLGTR